MKSILIIIDYFGSWPEWFPIYLESCRHNPTITWLFHTDCPFDSFAIDNVTFRHTTKEDYIQKVNDRLGIQFSPADSYKFCDLRPMYGVLHEEEIKEYDFYGYGDIDVIYGNIRKFYTDEVLENNIISTHGWCISGHLALIKNEKWLRNAFRRIKNWKKILENPSCQRFDEDTFISAFKYPVRWPWLYTKWPKAYAYCHDLLDPSNRKYRRKLHLLEQYTTPLTPNKWRHGNRIHPQVWFWKDGRITNELEGNREYIYLHFMNYKSGRWMDPVYGNAALWSELANIVNVQPADMQKGIRIDRFGFRSIDSPPVPKECESLATVFNYQ